MRMKRKFNQWIVYWPPGPVDDNGATTYLTPIEMKVRWEDGVEVRIDPNGDKWMSKAAIDSDYPLERLGVLWKGRLANVASPSSSPMLNVGASAIREVDDVPNRKASQALKTAYL